MMASWTILRYLNEDDFIRINNWGQTHRDRARVEFINCINQNQQNERDDVKIL